MVGSFLSYPVAIWPVTILPEYSLAIIARLLRTLGTLAHGRADKDEAEGGLQTLCAA